MKKLLKSVLLLSMLFAVVVWFVGCTASEQQQVHESSGQLERLENNDSDTQPENQSLPPMSDEPVTLTLYSHWAAINNDNDVQALFGTALEHYPNVTIELLRGVNMVDLIAAGEVPDLVAVPNGSMFDMLELELASDLTDFIQDFQIDLERFVPEAIGAIQSYSDEGEFLAIPYTLNYGLLIYNQDIFDQFAVPYPEDGMTWEEMIDLAQKVTQTYDGVQYIGLDPGAIKSLSRSYLLPAMDEDEEKPNLHSDGYQNMLALLKRIYDIPGTVDREANRYSYGIDFFLKDQRLAMHSVWLAAITSRLTEHGDSLSWDLAGHPVFPERPDIGKEIEFQSLLVTPNSENKIPVYYIIQAMVSDESQQRMNKGKNLTILNEPEWHTNFASDTQLFEGKNLEGIFSVKPAPASRYTKYDNQLYNYVGEALRAVVLENADINSALREANEKAEQYIAEKKAQE